ncbi:MAG: ribonuclease R [Planctomycetota bacterium]|nr:ribonuclease R [Planctomycetota bacterium]
MSLRYRKRLLDHLKHEDYIPRRMGDVALELRIPDDERNEFEETVNLLADEGVLVLSSDGKVSLPSLIDAGGVVTGIFRKNQKGFGFLTPAKSYREGTIFIPAEDTSDALSGDEVKIRVHRDRARERDFNSGPQFVGEVIEVIKRKRSAFTGELAKRGEQWLVYPDGREITEPIIVRDADSKNAKVGDKVVVEIVAYPQTGEGGTMTLAEGAITRVLGAAGRPDVETQAVIAAYDLPGEFPEECNEQAREVTQVYDRQIADFLARGIELALPGRADLTQDFIITIDPPDAKDYDDAISITRTEDGWELGVHIADVAHFIPPGSPIDEVARDRGNSCYLPRLVIPMIPELLSNGICSLQEGVHRFCKSAIIRYDRRGTVIGEGVRNTLIKSSKRLTYLEAQALIDGDMNEARKHAKTPPKYTDQLLQALAEMNELSRAIQQRRKRQGMISLELPDVVLVSTSTAM